MANEMLIWLAVGAGVGVGATLLAPRLMPLTAKRKMAALQGYRVTALALPAHEEPPGNRLLPRTNKLGTVISPEPFVDRSPFGRGEEVLVVVV